MLVYGQGSLECCSPWGCKEQDTTERLNCCSVLSEFGTSTDDPGGGVTEWAAGHRHCGRPCQ